MEEKQNRLKSWALWLSVTALIVFLVKTFTGYDAGPVVNELMNYLLPVLVGFGVINNPTDRKHL